MHPYTERRIFWKKYALEKLGGKCIQCGNDDERVLQFDHKFPQEKRTLISALVGLKDPQPYLDKELEICQILCANCHMIKTFHHNDTSRKRDRSSINTKYYFKHRGQLLKKNKNRYKLYRDSLSKDQILNLNTTKDEKGCWLFGTSLLNQPKRMVWKRKRLDVRIVGWELKSGQIVKSPSEVIQTCGKLACWNPEHLEKA